MQNNEKSKHITDSVMRILQEADGKWLSVYEINALVPQYSYSAVYDRLRVLVGDRDAELRKRETNKMQIEYRLVSLNGETTNV